MNDDGKLQFACQRELRSQCRNLRFAGLKVFKIIEAHFAERHKAVPERRLFRLYNPLEIFLGCQIRMVRMDAGGPKSVRMRLRDLLRFFIAFRLKPDVDKIHPCFPCAPDGIFAVIIKLGNVEVGVGIDEHDIILA